MKKVLKTILLGPVSSHRDLGETRLRQDFSIACSRLRGSGKSEWENAGARKTRGRCPTLPAPFSPDAALLIFAVRFLLFRAFHTVQATTGKGGKLRPFLKNSIDAVVFLLKLNSLQSDFSRPIFSPGCSRGKKSFSSLCC